jgi:tRNA dimethylallyltransferase
MSQPKIILVAGPTASGKSALGLELAHKYNGVIINADAMQIYAGLPILSAQPSPKDQKAARHLLYGILDAADKSSAGIWLKHATAAIQQTLDEKRTPILVGGTGLYFKALLGGLADIPEIPSEVRKATQKFYDELGEENFRRELAKLDPETAQRLAPNDRQRSIRAYEVAIHTGKPLGHWHTKHQPSLIDSFEIEKHLILPEREKLYIACDARFLKMIEHGAVEEVKAILQRNLNPELPAMKTLGVREIATYLRAEIGLNEAIAAAQQATRNYAKRQMTWFRNQWSKS